MKAILFIIAILISYPAFSQTGAYLVFNDTITAFEGQVIKKSDLCATDTIKTNTPGLKVESYSCSVVCEIDFEIKEESDVISAKFKDLLCNCLKYNNQKIYFENIILSDTNGNKYHIDSQVFKVIIE